MNKKEKVQKLAKLLGKGLSVMAICFVVYKFSQIEFDWKKVLSVSNILVCLGLVVVQVFVIVTACYPWMSFVEILTDKRVGFDKSMIVFTKANIFKYVPGNVFQYVARNELANVAQVSHLDVAMATVLDTGLSLVFAFVLSLLLLRGIAIEYISNYGIGSKKILGILLAGVLVLAIAIIALYKKWLREKINTCLKRLNLKNMVRLLKILGYYLFNNIANCFIFYVIITVMFAQNNSISEIYRLMGSFVFSLIIGMVTPGASGGIGIRESVMLFITEGAFDSAVIVSAMVLLRVVSILGDVGAFLTGKIYCLIKKEGEI